MIEAVFSHDPSEGRFEVYVDGRLRVTIKGRDTFTSATATQLPMVKFGPYGVDGVGTVDVDNIVIGPDGSMSPLPPVVNLPAPSNLRLVLQ